MAYRIGLMTKSGWAGGVDYIKNIILALSSLPTDTRKSIELCLICEHTDDLEIYASVVQALDKIFFLPDFVSTSILSRSMSVIKKNMLGYVNPRVSAGLKQAQIDFVYPYFASQQELAPFHSANWIVDFQHKYLPEYFSPKEIESRDKVYTEFARRSETLVVSSKNAQADVMRYFPNAAKKTKVLSFRTSAPPEWLSVDAITTQRQYNLPERFFLISNQFWKHKNHIKVFEALAYLKQKQVQPIIVCTGRLDDYRNPEYANTVLQKIRELEIAPQVYLLGLIPKIDQIQLVRRSLALLQPSLFEGWSTLVEDGRALGKKIILSDIPIHKEQAPDQAVFFDPNSVESIAHVLQTAWETYFAGPDINSEYLAQSAQLKRVQDFANQFLSVAKGYA